MVFFALSASALGLSAAGTNAPNLLKISAWEATNYYDQEVVVTGKVAQVTIRPAVTFLNLDKAYPDSPCTVVIFHGRSSFFGDANALRGTSIEIRGRVRNYRDRPEIVLNTTNQLTVFGLTNWPAPVHPMPKTNSPPPAATATNLPEVM